MEDQLAYLQQASPITSFPPLEAMTNKIKQKKKKILSIYLSSKGRHEEGDVEFFIVQSIEESSRVGNAIPP